MTNEGTTKDDVKIPEGELGEKIRADFDDGKEVFVSITKAMNEEACLSYRVAQTQQQTFSLMKTGVVVDIGVCVCVCVCDCVFVKFMQLLWNRECC